MLDNFAYHHLLIKMPYEKSKHAMFAPRCEYPVPSVTEQQDACHECSRIVAKGYSILKHCNWTCAAYDRWELIIRRKGCEPWTANGKTIRDLVTQKDVKPNKRL